MKTIAARILETQGIRYELKEYQVDEQELDAVSVAHKIGLLPEQVFKTLVARGDKYGVLVACIAAPAELDLKALAALSGNKRVELVPLREVQPLTGYIRGGVSPLGMRKKYPTFLDETIEILDLVSVSAGQRGLQLWLSGPDLLRAVEGTAAALTK